nr:MAG TPA: hypothetical protein [Caudoviricetes sp.]
MENPKRLLIPRAQPPGVYRHEIGGSGGLSEGATLRRQKTQR